MDYWKEESWKASSDQSSYEEGYHPLSCSNRYNNPILFSKRKQEYGM